MIKDILQQLAPLDEKIAALRGDLFIQRCELL